MSEEPLLHISIEEKKGHRSETSTQAITNHGHKERSSSATKLKRTLFSCCMKRAPPTERNISFAGTVDPPNDVRNVIRNQKYSIFLFIPIVLYNQFKFFFNLFFLLTAISQIFTILQTGYLVSYVAPLSLVLLLTMCKEAYDDFERFKRDKEANSTKYVRIVGERREDVPSADLKVGDIIEVVANKRIPADLLLLHTAEANGSVFIKTDQLDGETDWKVRKAIRFTQSYFDEHGSFEGLDESTTALVNPPIIDIYQFEGVFSAYKDGIPVKEALSLENTIWASTVLAAGKAYGMVLYTGREMRVVMNTTSPRSKTGQVEKEVNLLSKVLFVALSALALGMVGLQGFQDDWFVQFFRFVILLSSIIPISLRVNLDFSKLTYSRMMSVDEDIPGTIVRNRSIPEELGRLEFLLTDKTGTLTQNEMIFKKLALENGELYTSDQIEEIRRILRKKKERSNTQTRHGTHISNKSVDTSNAQISGLELVVPSSQISNRKDSSNSTGASNQSKKIMKGSKDQLVVDMVTALALCHNVTPVMDEGKKVYQASSPDEIALVETIDSLNFRLISRDQHSIVIEDAVGSEETYEILANFPFSSETKRMGIILKNVHTKQITFYLKGADVIMKDKVPERQRGYLLDMCETLAIEGLRTLVITEKHLTEEEYDTWKLSYEAATQSMSNRQANIRKTIESLEHNMRFLGITGVEDKLQEDVRNTLENLRNAGIKVWMLTGDKIETAITIAISTGIKSARQGVFIMKELTDLMEITNKLNTFSRFEDHVLVIDGTTLDVALNSCYRLFFESTSKAPSVVCCRCSPTQKAQITEGIKTVTKKKTCAIGDGGNDVGMIQAADVGIGLEGKEGKQAALAADYSILKFRYMNKLLLWHGRLSYKRSAVMAHFVIHRGLIISFIQAFFSIVFYDLSISIYNGILILGYTTLFTFFPVFSLVFDRDIDAKRALNHPPLYKSLQKGRELNLKNFFIWLWISIYQAAVIMLLSLYLFDNSYYNIMTITFTALILSELLNVTTALNRVHAVAICSIASSLIVYALVIVLMKKDINAATIDLEFLYKVAFLTLLSWLPIHIAKVLRAKFAPTEGENDYERSN